MELDVKKILDVDKKQRLSESTPLLSNQTQPMRPNNYVAPLTELPDEIWQRIIFHLENDHELTTNKYFRRDEKNIIKTYNDLKLTNKELREKIIHYLKKDHSKRSFLKKLARKIRNNKLYLFANRLDKLSGLQMFLNCVVAIATPSLLIDWFQVAYKNSYFVLREIAISQNWSYLVYNVTGPPSIKDYTLYTLQSPAICQYQQVTSNCAYDPDMGYVDCYPSSINDHYTFTDAPAGFWFAMFFAYLLAIILIQMASWSLQWSSKIGKGIITALALTYAAIAITLPLMIDIYAWVAKTTIKDVCYGFWQSAFQNIDYFMPQLATSTPGGPFLVQHTDELLQVEWSLQAVLPQLGTGYAPFYITCAAVGFTLIYSYLCGFLDYYWNNQANKANGLNPDGNPDFFNNDTYVAIN